MLKDTEKQEREDRAARLVHARKAAGYTSAAKAAEQFNWNVNNYKAHESGRNGFGIADARKYAVAFGTSPDWLTFGDVGDPETSEVKRVALGSALPIKVNGKVAAGLFREVEDFDQSEPETIWDEPDPDFPNARRMAFDVEGDSVNALKPRPIMDGDRLICVSFEDVADQVRVRDGMVVVVERTRDGGHTREWSVKQVELYEDRTEFHPRSTDPRYKPIVIKRDATADDGVKVEIIALVRSVKNRITY